MPTYTLADLAEAIQARLEGDPAVSVSGFAPLDLAGPGDLSFLANQRYASEAESSTAAALIVDGAYQRNSQNLLRHDNPYLAFARAVELLAPEIPHAPGVHASAVVHPSCRVPDDATIEAMVVLGEGVSLGQGVVVGAGSVVEAGVSIGDGSRLFPRVTVHSGTTIGRRCIVQSGSVLGSDGFGYAMDERGRHHHVPQRGGLDIGDDVEIGASVTVDRGSAGDTLIVAGTKIDNLVHIAHNCSIGANALIVAQVGIAGSTRIGDYAVLGGQAGVIGHAKIGDRARVGAQAGVIGDVAEDTEVSGYPARSHREQMRSYAIFARLPELLDRLRALENRIKDRS